MGSPPLPSGDAGSVLAERMLFQAKACRRLGSPLYSELLEHVAVDLEEGGPSWEILQGHEHDPRGSALALRLMGAVNRLVLGGEEPGLERIYRDPNGDRVEAWREFHALLEREPERLRDLVNRPVQTNEVGRCAGLLPGFLAVAAMTGLPLRLLEVGASAGLNLYWDRYLYVSDRASWGPLSPLEILFEVEGDGTFPEVDGIEIAERRGCDAAPIDPSSADGRADLLAYVWPDQTGRIERMRAALEIATSDGRAEVNRASAAVWVKRVLREPAPGRATILFHSIVEQYLSEEELTSFHRSIREAGRRATLGAPLAWLRMEPDGDRAAVRLTLWPDGEDRLIARAGYHGNPIELCA
ncbi:MAG: DUF2332 domain-containing protein [Solirubrobacterales bacterium]